MARYQFTVDAMIHRYQEYKQIWEAEDGEVKDKLVTGMICML